MSVVLALEDFGSENSGLSNFVLSEETLEDRRLSAFEGGYKAGWDDATIALATEQRNLALQVQQHLLDISFTYHEARSQILKNIDPFISELLNKFIPTIAQDSIALQIRTELLTLVKSHLDGKVMIVASQEAHTYLEETLRNESLPHFLLESDPNLASSQVYLRVGSSEKCFDADALIQDAKIKISDFFREQQGRIING